VKLPEHTAPPAASESFTPNAVVIAHAKKWAFVLHGRQELLCAIDERLREGKTTLIAPGDHVFVDAGDAEPTVRWIAPRGPRLSRPAGPHDPEAEQVIAANVDVLVVVAAAAHPPFRPGLVDRYLIAAQIGGVAPILCLNKMDLVSEEPAEIEIYRELNIPVIKTSCTTGEGIEQLRRAIAGKVAVLSGHSGVGKSSLLTALDPNLVTHTQPVSEATQRGRHTTTSARLYELACGTRVIDTPGLRALGLWQVTPQEITYYFPDLAEAAVACKFRDCTHTHEPQCGVRSAVESGALHRARYDSYLRIRASLESESGTTPGRLSVIWHHHQ
jgi:ribosome biogenesis GTPase